MLALIITLLAPVDVVLHGAGDAILMACHDTQHGWFTGRACLDAAAQAKVRQDKGKPFKLGAGSPTKCGGTEGHFAFGPAPDFGPIYSADRAPRPCPERKPYHLPDKQAKAVHDALVADMKRNPHAYMRFDEPKQPPVAKQFSMNHAVEIDIEGKGREEQIVSLTDMGRKLHFVVRLAGEKATVLAVNPYGPTVVTRGMCGDFDGDGVAEVIVAEGGETERVYSLIRFVRGEADVVAALGCGD